MISSSDVRHKNGRIYLACSHASIGSDSSPVTPSFSQQLSMPGYQTFNGDYYIVMSQLDVDLLSITDLVKRTQTEEILDSPPTPLTAWTDTLRLYCSRRRVLSKIYSILVGKISTYAKFGSLSTRATTCQISHDGVILYCSISSSYSITCFANLSYLVALLLAFIDVRMSSTVDGVTY